MPAVIDSGTGGELNPGFDGSGGPVATAIAVIDRPTMSVSTGGDVLSAQTTYGWDQVSSEARYVLAEPSGSVGDSVTLTINGVQRFVGTIVTVDTTLSPHSVAYTARGPLYALEIFKNDVASEDDAQTRPGLAFVDLVGSESGTLRQVIAAVLDYCGVSYSLGNFQNPAHVYGVLSDGSPGATDEMTWGVHETAAAYIHRFLEASAGYRLFDSADGNIYLRQITASPAGSGDIPDFTAGVDIFGDTTHSGTSIGRQSAVIVTGYDDGSGPATSGVVGSGVSAFQVNSNLIETDTFAAEIANFWLPQVNRLQEIVRLTTPRDDLIGPAQTHFIAGVAADHMWVKSVTCELAANGELTQHITYVSGA